MEINEAVERATGPEKEELCQEEPPTYQAGKLVIDDIKGGVGDAAVLAKNMLAQGRSGVKECRMLALGWDVLNISGERYPVQTHHLVPEKGLKNQKITAFLTDSPPNLHKDYILGADTNYDTNGARNGYFMPFASTTHQWNLHPGDAARKRICWEVMRRSGIQLHQGKHSHTDYLEESDIETSSYHDMVNRLLDKISDRISAHVKTCSKCKDAKKGMKNGRVVIRPLEKTVEFMNLVSILLRMLINSNRIFVSRKASEFFTQFQQNGHLRLPTATLLKEEDL